MSSTKLEVIERLHKLVSKVGEHTAYRLEDEILEFIEEAVDSKMKNLVGKYYVDERSGCIAVRKRVDYEIGNGLSSDLPDVVAFWQGYKVRDDEGRISWKIYDRQRGEAHQLCDRFNNTVEE
jgi:hypothetical protein